MEKAKDCAKNTGRPQNFTKIHMKVELLKVDSLFILI